MMKVGLDQKARAARTGLDQKVRRERDLIGGQWERDQTRG